MKRFDLQKMFVISIKTSREKDERAKHKVCLLLLLTGEVFATLPLLLSCLKHHLIVWTVTHRTPCRQPRSCTGG